MNTSHNFNNYRKLTPDYNYPYDTEYNGFKQHYSTKYNTYLTEEEEDILNRTIYQHQYNEKPLHNFRNKHILLTFKNPTKEQINLMNTNHNITIIFISDPYTAIIKNHNTRFVKTTPIPTDPTHTRKTIYRQINAMLIYNHIASLTTYHYDYYANSPSSIYNLQHTLSTHGTPVILNDLTLHVKLNIPPCANHGDKFITPSNYEEYTTTLKLYTSLIPKAEHIMSKPIIITTETISFVTLWAPAYDIDIPDPNNMSYISYNIEMINLYNQIKQYHHYNLPMTEHYDVCSYCHKPYRYYTEDGIQECPHCLLQDEDLLEDYYQDYCQDYTWHTQIINNYIKQIFPPKPEDTTMPLIPSHHSYLDHLNGPVIDYNTLDIYYKLYCKPE